MWLLKGALRDTHEYLADNEVLNKTTSQTKYQSLLLKQIDGLLPLVVVTNSFNSTIKNRIKMMCRNKSSVLAKLKPLLLVPVITCLTLIFACNEKPKDLTVDNSQKTSTQEDLEINEPIVVENDSQISALEETEISEPDVEENDSQKESLLEGRELFYIVDDLPTFNGGEAGIEFRKYIARNIRYPESAAENDIYGRILVQFVIDKTGSVMDATVVRSLDPALDKEAIRVVMSSPAWEPGKHMGKLVEVLFTFPINFVLNKQ